MNGSSNYLYFHILGTDIGFLYEAIQMLQEFLQLIEHHVDPSTKDSLMGLTQALEKHGAVLYKDHLYDLFTMANEIDRGELADRARVIVYTQVNVLLSQMRIVLDLEQLSLDDITDVLNALVLEPSDYDQEALDAIRQSEDDIDALAEMLSVFTTKEAVEYMPVILSVDNHTIDAISKKLETNLSYSIEGIAALNETIQAMHRHQALVGDKPTVAMEMLHNGYPICTSHRVILGKDIAELLSLSPERIADELISAVIMSGVDKEAVCDEVSHLIESYIDDITLLQKVHMRSNERLKQMGYMA
jgi:hypothetical protein